MPADDAIAHEAIELEQQFAANSYRGASSEPFITREGNLPIIVSSAHAVKHPRAGRMQGGEAFTGSLAIQLVDLTHVFALIYASTSQEDPNYDPRSAYKEQLKDLVARCHAGFVLDLHGMARSRPRRIAIGTAGNASLLGRLELLDALQSAFQQQGLSEIDIDDTDFAASGPNTIASFASRELHIAALQVEIHRDYRDPLHDARAYARLLHALQAGLLAIAELL